MARKAAKRKGLSKKLRFEVFKRDSFCCQYCGRSAPDVLLVVDHIEPVSKGGVNALVNLITACRDCNSGKAGRLLSDESVALKQKKQLDELNERREQLKLMAKWKTELLNLQAESVEMIADYWAKIAGNYSLNEHGKAAISRLLKKYSTAEILAAIDGSVDYMKLEGEKYTQESVEKALGMIGRICSVRRAVKDKPYLKDVFSVRARLKYRGLYVNEWKAKQLLEAVLSRKPEWAQDMRDLAGSASNWTAWQEAMQGWIESAGGNTP